MTLIPHCANEEDETGFANSSTASINKRRDLNLGLAPKPKLLVSHTGSLEWIPTAAVSLEL